MVALGYVSNMLGSIAPVQQISELAHKVCQPLPMPRQCQSIRGEQGGQEKHMYREATLLVSCYRSIAIISKKEILRLRLKL